MSFIESHVAPVEPVKFRGSQASEATDCDERLVGSDRGIEDSLDLNRCERRRGCRPDLRRRDLGDLLSRSLPIRRCWLAKLNNAVIRRREFSLLRGESSCPLAPLRLVRYSRTAVGWIEPMGQAKVSANGPRRFWKSRRCSSEHPDDCRSAIRSLSTSATRRGVAAAGFRAT